MTTFCEYMTAKRVAAQSRAERAARGEVGPRRIQANTVVRMEPDECGRIGIRRTFVRGHVIDSDSGPDLGGYDAGPSPVELLLTALGGCLAHTFMLQAAARRVEFSNLEVDVSATMDPRAGLVGFPDIPLEPHDVQFDLRVASNAPERALRTAFEAVERLCPVTAALTRGVSIAQRLEIDRSG